MHDQESQRIQPSSGTAREADSHDVVLRGGCGVGDGACTTNGSDRLGTPEGGVEAVSGSRESETPPPLTAEARSDRVRELCDSVAETPEGAVELTLLAGIPLGVLYGRGWFGPIDAHLRAVEALLAEDQALWAETPAQWQ